MKNGGINRQKRGPALQFTEGIDQLCDLIISRLEEKWKGGLAFQAGCHGFVSRLPLHFLASILYAFCCYYVNYTLPYYFA